MSYLHKAVKKAKRLIFELTTWKRALAGTGLKGLDKRLISYLDLDTKGFYVELGAYDGVEQSNTYALQRRYGWSGILIEPSPEKYVKCLKNRDFGNRPSIFCNACVDKNYLNEFVRIESAGLMSTASGLDLNETESKKHADMGLEYLANKGQRFVYGAKARTLTEILETARCPKEFDLLSLDVEGNELSVLRGLDFDMYAPTRILVEVRSSSIELYLSQFGYKVEAVLDTNVSEAESMSCRDLLFIKLQ